MIDCDPGIDDALALLFAFASPEIKVDAVTAVYGNAPVSNTLKNILRILYLADVASFPEIGKGCDKPFKGKSPKKRETHGSNGLGDTNLKVGDLKIDIKDGVELIIEKTLEGRIDCIIALGPLTNIAAAILKEPKVKERLRELIIMGGILYPSVSFNSCVEFNIGCDPDAAKEVFNSSIPIKLISLDATQKVVFKEEHLRVFKQIDNPLSNFIVKIAKFSIDFHKRIKNKDGAFLHDPLAVGIAIDKGLGSFEDLCLDVKLRDERGRVFLKEGRPNISFCKSVKADEFLNLFIDRVSTYCNRASQNSLSP